MRRFMGCGLGEPGCGDGMGQEFGVWPCGSMGGLDAGGLARHAAARVGALWIVCGRCVWNVHIFARRCPLVAVLFAAQPCAGKIVQM